jgi:dTDP-4-amino-4,6-dideoxygalactose transaminase
MALPEGSDLSRRAVSSGAPALPVLRVSERARDLAAFGGVPVRRAPFPPWPYFADDEVRAVVGVLRSGLVNYWTGEEGREFEREFAAAVGARYAVALTNGTVALELALRAAGVGPGDEVVVPARTFIGTASAAVAVGASPVVADVDASSQTLTAATVRAVVTPRTKAVIPVHLTGWPAPMGGLRAFADGHVAAWSFCQDKILTTAGEGGMVTTDDEAIWRAVWEYKDHGKSYEAVYEREHPPGFRWLHDSFGTNARMTEVQAAAGRRALAKLPEWSERRRRYAAALDAGLGELPGLRVTVPPDGVGHAYYKYSVFVRPEALAPGWNRDRIMTAVAAEGVPCLQGGCAEIYREKAFDAPPARRPPAPLPVARELGETSLMLLVHPTLSERDIDDTVAAFGKVMAVAAAD